MPLVRSFELSTKQGKKAWVEPVVHRNQHPPVIQFEVKTGEGKAPEAPKLGRGARFRCLACALPVDDKHIKAEGTAGRMGVKLMAIVAEGKRGRIYLKPTKDHEDIASRAKPTWYPEAEISPDRRSMFTPLYGLKTFGDLFTPRQLVALTTLSDLISEAQAKIQQDAATSGMPDDDKPLNDGGTGAKAYADAVATYLAFAIDKLADRGSTICGWDVSRSTVTNTFGRQAIPMTWDFAEANPFSSSTGNYQSAIKWVSASVEKLPYLQVKPGFVEQRDATTTIDKDKRPLVFTTDPPYYDNIGYADLSDFFYVWLRRSLSTIYPSLFSTLTTPKSGELIYAPHRFDGDKAKAKQFFEDGLKKAFQQTYEASHPEYPFTVFYAFKQAEKDSKSDLKENGLNLAASTGWETMLESLIQSGFSVTGTWPMRTELVGNLKKGMNALASSIALVCRPLPADAPQATRRQFLTELKRDLPPALKTLQQGNIAPVDLAQASIGPGMAIFSQYKQVLEADGTLMRVRTALQLINQTLDEYLSEQEGDFDADTRWALTWFEQHQFEPADFGIAETLSKAKNTSIQGLVDAGILAAKGGKVRLLQRDELPDDWNPAGDTRTPVWEAAQHLIRALDRSGESGAAALLAQLNGQGENAKELAYRLYTICDRKGWAQEGVAYNSLVISWPEIARLAEQQQSADQQGEINLPK
jgi:putative DNA methylase